MNTTMDASAVNILHQLGLTEQDVREHVFRPDHLTDKVLMSEPPPASPVRDQPGGPDGIASLLYRLNTTQLQRDLQALLRPRTVGYSMQLRQRGRVVFNDQWGYAKLPGDWGFTGDQWTASTPMHLASVSKVITAMAMIRVLDSRHISVDTPIWPFLPKYWVKGDSVEQLTFRHLLIHRSGLVVPKIPNDSDYPTMKASIAHGLHGVPGYGNIHYGLMRILISTIDAPHLFKLPFFDIETADDAYWDCTTIAYYSQYVNEHIFAPLGISSGFLHTDPNALGYTWPVRLPSFNSDNLSTMSGGVGWHLSVNDLLTVMGAFRRSGTIVDPWRAQDMLQSRFGIYDIIPSNLGTIYGKGGFWSNDNGVEQSNVFFLPRGMEFAILSNSAFGKPGFNFAGEVQAAIINNIQLSALSLTTTAVGSVALLALIRGVGAKK